MSAGEAASARRGGAWLRYAPVVGFAALAGLFAAQLLAPEPACDRPDAQLDRALPEFELALLPPETGQFSPASLKDQGVTVVNLWASWCAPCRVEHPQLMALTEVPGLRMVGVNYKDRAGAGRRFLAELGDPFDTVVADPDGQAAVAFGITGVPETFVVNSDGRVVYRHVGQITPSDIGDCLLPAIARAQ